MSELEMQRIIGRLEQMALTTSQQLEDARSEMRDVKREVGEIRKTLDEARGGWKLILWVSAGGLTTLAAGVVALFRSSTPT